MTWWTRPAWWIGRYSAPLRGAVHRDRVLLQRWRMGWMPPAVIAVGIVWGLLHLGMDDVYTESAAFLGLAMVVGFLAPSVAVLLVLGFGLGDLAWALGENVAGRLVALWLLWLLAVQIPLAARGFERELGVRLHAALAGLGASLFAGFLVYLWEIGMPLLLRPVFTWRGHSPETAAFQVVTDHTAGLALAGAAMAALSSVLRAPLKTSTFPPGEEVQVGRVPYLLGVGLALFALSGIISGPVDLAVLAVALLLVRPVSAAARAIGPVNDVLGRVPRALRFVLGFGLAYCASAPFTALAGWLRPTEWFPIVISVALGMLIFAFLLGPAPRYPVLLAALLLAMTAPAMADNFSSWSDAFGTAAAGAAAAAGAIAGGLAAAFGCGDGAAAGGAAAGGGQDAQGGKKEDDETPEERAQRIKDEAAKAARDNWNDCADSVAAAAAAVGYTDLPDPATTTANDQIDYMAENWEELDMATAKERADKGDFVVAGKKGEKHGHTAVVVTGDGVVREGKTWPNVAGGSKGTPAPAVETPGKAYSEGGNTIRDAWGSSSRNDVKYYTPKGEPSSPPAGTGGTSAGGSQPGEGTSSGSGGAVVDSSGGFSSGSGGAVVDSSGGFSSGSGGAVVDSSGGFSSGSGGAVVDSSGGFSSGSGGAVVDSSGGYSSGSGGAEGDAGTDSGGREAGAEGDSGPTQSETS